MVAERTFREDLYFRLNICHFPIPPLRERRDEIALLFDFFMRKISADANQPAPVLDPDVHRFFVEFYPFPGNIRELKNLAQYIVAIYTGEPVRIGDLSQRYAEAWRKHHAGLVVPMAGSPEAGVGILGDARRLAERQQLVDTLTRHKGDIRAVCGEFNLSRARVYQLIRKYDLQPSRFRGE
jgi:DNA-binding NtrC family response regulator